MLNHAPKIDVALSFAGEDRAHAEALAAELKAHNVTVFYDKNEKDILWGKDLYQHLTDLYRNQAKYCVVFVSKHYAGKLWTNHELKAAQARAFSEAKEYILPVRLDDTELPGILPTTGYLSIPPETPATLTIALIAKLGRVAGNTGTPGGPVAATPTVAVGPSVASVQGSPSIQTSSSTGVAVQVNRQRILTALTAMSRTQFNKVIFHLNVPRNELLPDAVQQDDRAMEIVQRYEQSGAGGLVAIERAIKEVAPYLLS